MSLIQRIESREATVAVIGLGVIGLCTVALAKAVGAEQRRFDIARADEE